MNDAYLLTGGNMGDRLSFLTMARQGIENNCGRIVQTSSIYETAAWGKEDQEAFLNQVIHIETHLEPLELLSAVLKVEEELGRKREVRYGPRFIDIDIIFYNDEVIDLPGLKVPHPQMQNRRFVLVPLAELAADKVHPLYHKSVQQLLKTCPDPLAVNKFS
jgi:2-amino-4-hydroxy-6-hydroxymethyldihydropteridine diphosphokinase